MDVDALEAFVAVADTGQFQRAALEMSLTQQAVSKRIAALERTLEVRLFTRTARGAALTVDGQVFLPHARTVIEARRRAIDSVHPGRRPLRVDVINRRIAPARLVRQFHDAHPEVELEVVALFDANAATALAAVQAGSIDATFRAVTSTDLDGTSDLDAVRVLDEPHQLLVGRHHPLSQTTTLTPHLLQGHRLWMPGATPGTEWSAYYDALAVAFDLTIETLGPNFGTEHLLEVLADSASLATLVGEGTSLLWPEDYALRRIPVRNPTPAYPHSLITRSDNPHPALTALRTFMRDRYRVIPGTWTPAT